MKFEEFVELFKTIKGQHAVRDEFLKSLPDSIRDAFFDNELVESLYTEIDIMSSALFSVPMWDDIQYFLFDDMTPWYIKNSDKEWIIYTESDIFDYFKEAYTWDEE